MPSTAERLAAIRERIRRTGRDPSEVVIVAVTKGRPLSACRDAFGAGLTVLGENRVQEALPKIDALPEAEWHLIGHLQTNKVRVAAGRFSLIHSVDSEARAGAIAAASAGQPVLLQINVSREPAKHGASPEDAVELAKAIAGMLELRGLMGIGPRDRDPGPAFAELARLRNEAEQAVGKGLPILSMGMSEDFEAACRAGSTMIRLGRILFGEDSVL